MIFPRKPRKGPENTPYIRLRNGKGCRKQRFMTGNRLKGHRIAIKKLKYIAALLHIYKMSLPLKRTIRRKRRVCRLCFHTNSGKISTQASHKKSPHILGPCPGCEEIDWDSMLSAWASCTCIADGLPEPVWNALYNARAASFSGESKTFKRRKVMVSSRKRIRPWS